MRTNCLNKRNIKQARVATNLITKKFSKTCKFPVFLDDIYRIEGRANLPVILIFLTAQLIFRKFWKPVAIKIFAELILLEREYIDQQAGIT